MFQDPALILSCDLPPGWCVSSESSLSRIAFRPWDRGDERLIVTALPVADPLATPESWQRAICARLKMEDAAAVASAGGGAIIASPMTLADGSPMWRAVTRGRAFDVVVDLVGPQPDGRVPTLLLRIASSARVPARGPAPESAPLSSAHEKLQRLLPSGDRAACEAASRELLRAAEEAWLRSLLLGRVDALDLTAFQIMVRAACLLGDFDDLAALNRAHALLTRALPSTPPREPCVPAEDPPTVGLAQGLAGALEGVVSALRRQPRPDSAAWMPDAAVDERVGRELILGNLLTEQVRAFFKDGGRSPRPWEVVLDVTGPLTKAREACLSLLGAIAHMGEPDSLLGPGAMPEVLNLAGRALTALVEAAAIVDDTDAMSEGAELLADVARRLFERASDDPPRAAERRALAAQYATTSLAKRANVLNRAADEPSLRAALQLVKQAEAWLAHLPSTCVDALNIRHAEQNAALQLGDAERAWQAIRAGYLIAQALPDTFQIKFFGKRAAIAEAIAAEPRRVRSGPELRYLGSVVTHQVGAHLKVCCQWLAWELASQPTSIQVFEAFLFGAHLLGEAHAADLLDAASALLDLRRILVRSQALQIAGDDALLARRMHAGSIAPLVETAPLAALAAADRAAARVLLLDLQFEPERITELRRKVRTEPNPGVSRAKEIAAREGAAPPHLQSMPPWGRPEHGEDATGPWATLARCWLQELAREMKDWANGLLSTVGVASLTEADLLSVVADHGQPVVVIHPTEDRVALLVLTPDGKAHGTWAPGTAAAILERAEALRAALGVWTSERSAAARGGAPARFEGEGERPDWRVLAADLHALLVAPIKTILAPYAAVTFVPYRELGAVPFALLQDRSGAPLVDGLALSVAPSISTLAALRRRPDPEGSGDLAYVVGDPRSPRESALPGASAEADAVHAAIRAARGGAAVVLRKGVEATPAAYVKEARGARILHLACHGRVDASASDAALAFAPGPNGVSDLSVDMIAGVPLSRAIVFLAACRSGAGRPTADGTVGLAREFLRAGASAVVGSYWNVPDPETARLTARFYDALLTGREGVAASLQRATRELRDALKVDGRDAAPGAWGGFYVLGDGAAALEPVGRAGRHGARLGATRVTPGAEAPPKRRSSARRAR